MNLRLIVLFGLALSVLYLLARLSWSPEVATERVLSTFGDDAIAVSVHEGLARSLSAVWLRDTVSALPLFVLGAALGVVLRLWVRWWRAPQNLQPPEEVVVADVADVRFRVLGSHFDHAPQADVLPLATVSVPDGASVIERDAFAAIAHARPPSDLAGRHGVPLLEHTRLVYERVVAKRGAGSLAAIGAALHDLPKVIGYRFDPESGQWRNFGCKETGDLAGRALIQLPAFWRLPVEERNRLMLLMQVLSKQPEPLDLPADIKAAAVDVWAADRGNTSIDKSAAIKDDLDLAPMCEALRGLVDQAQAATWNVNGALRAHDAIEAHFSPDDGLLFVEAHRIRRWLCDLVPAEMAAHLALNQTTESFPLADETVMEALRMESIAVDVAAGVKSGSGWFTVAHGRSRPRKCAALGTHDLAPELRKRWGYPPKELRIEAA
jgi:hypothetical protein